ncbi:hypothetical protein [Garciella nitratireducens]|uniref:Uncharacterized protein n=1 Tax=Garciella nitratireducens DSM 15102 TaxID=1121911 RepID=A0A1T4MB85_9FIRM|nr:hypothetical protein [Garciella nitratireducens]SJZ64279.1 hypothetical protein SAMN02745973_01281 [Garciella nitratireducens DSM 15102]
MLQIYILYKIKLKNKCKFYKSFFSINSIKSCYIFYITKEIITFLLTSFILFFFYKNVDNFGLSETAIYIILFVLLFIQQLGYNKTTRNYIQTHLDLYRLSSTTYFNFFCKTIIYHCVADFCFKLASLLPIIIFSCLWSPKSIFVIIWGLLAGFIIRINETLHSLTKDIDHKFKIVISFLKTTFGLLVIFIAFTIGFHVINATLYIVKILLTSSTYEEALLLNDLILSFTNSLNWLKTILQNYLPFFVIYFVVLLITPIIFNIVEYIYLWKNKTLTIQHSVNNEIPNNVLNQKGLPFLKIVYKQNLNDIFTQIRKQPEILVWLIIEYVILYNIHDEISKFLFIIWFYFIGNSNYIRSLFVIGTNAFSNYVDNVDLYYWRLANNSFWGIYNERLKALRLYTSQITLYQSIFACIFSLLFLSDWILILLSAVIIIFLRKPMQLFNCRLVSFSSFFTFANSCKSKLRTSDLDESELIEDKLQNIFKLPFTLAPMIIIVFNYIYSFLNIYICLLIIFLLSIFAIFINKQISQYVKKSGDILEKVNVLD